MFTTILDDNQARFGMMLGDDVWKVVYYFLQKDGSIGVGSYFEGNCSVVMELPELPSSEYKVNLQEAETHIQLFLPKKTSFHKSGTIVIKDRAGNRFPGDTDLRSIKFEDIKDAIQIRLIYPANLGNYKKGEVDEIINVFDPQYHDPSMIKLFLTVSEFNFEEWMLSKHPESTIFADTETLKEFDLIIYTICQPSNNKFIPEAEAVGHFLF